MGAGGGGGWVREGGLDGGGRRGGGGGGGEVVSGRWVWMGGEVWASDRAPKASQHADVGPMMITTFK